MTYEEYTKAHPEEMGKLSALYAKTLIYEREREERRKKRREELIQWEEKYEQYRKQYFPDGGK